MRSRAPDLPLFDGLGKRVDEPAGQLQYGHTRSTRISNGCSARCYFYDTFYRAETKKRTGKELGEDGKLVIYPGNGLEYAVDSTNSVDCVSGLQALTEGLLRYPKLPAADRQRLEQILAILPSLPTAKRLGRDVRAAGPVV